MLNDIDLDERIKRCNSFNDIYELLDSINGLHGSYKFWDSDKIKKSVKIIEQYKYNFNLVTRSCGLRKRIMEIMNCDEADITYWCGK